MKDNKLSIKELFFKNTNHVILKSGRHRISCGNNTWEVIEDSYQEAINLAVNYFAEAYLKGEYSKGGE